jgi:tryptophan-rich sensory protein
VKTVASHRAEASRTKKLAIFALLLAACLGVGQLGAWLTRPRIDTWYATLVKPAWTPPDLAFPIVWTALYVMMAVAAWFLWLRSRPGEARWPLVLFAVQLALNLLWSVLFFGLRSPGAALIGIAALITALAATILSFQRISTLAAWLLIPYLLWTCFAAALNFAIWRLNS